MKRGLVLGKYMPVHNGHLNLIDFALTVCDELIVWVCESDQEKMPGQIRLKWIQEIYKNNPRVVPVLFQYNESDLPNTSVSDEEVSYVWSQAIKTNLPKIDVIITSEKYGDYVAEYLNIEHCFFKTTKMVSATLVRTQPYQYWHEIPEPVKPYYYKKICLLGTESTGKTTLVQKLAAYFNGDYVLEVGREVVPDSNECTFNDLEVIAKEHAIAIQNKASLQNRILFVDTDIHITKSYADYLFNSELEAEPWIIQANHCDLYLYLDKDAPYIQDGTRFSEDDRNTLDSYHKNTLKKQGINYQLIQGNWDDRFKKCVEAVKDMFMNL